MRDSCPARQPGSPRRSLAMRPFAALFALTLAASAFAEPVAPNRAGTVLRDAPSAAGTGATQQSHPTAPVDLPEAAGQAFAAGRPLVLMFSLRGCPWCDALRREHFTTLVASQDRLGVVALEIDLADSQAFSSAPTAPQPVRPASLLANSPRELGRLHKVRLAPTVLFLGPNGEVAERLVGYGSPDFFGAYLDQRIAQARAAMRPAAR